MPLRKLNTYHMRKRWLKRLLDIKWQSKVTNNEVLKQVNLAREPALQVDIATPYHEERLQGRPRSLGNIPVSDRPQAESRAGQEVCCDVGREGRTEETTKERGRALQQDAEFYLQALKWRV